MANKSKHNDGSDSYWILDNRIGEFGEVPIDISGYEFSPNTVSYVTALNFKTDSFYDESSIHTIDIKKFRHI